MTTSGGAIVAAISFSWAIASEPPTKIETEPVSALDVEAIQHRIDTGLNAGPQTEMV